MPELPEMPDRFGSERVAEITDKLTPELLAAWFEATEPRDPAKHYVDGAVTLDDQVLLHTSIDFITRDGEVIARWRELVREARAHLTLGFPLVFRSYSTSRDQETDPERRLVYIRLDTSTLPEAAGPGHGPFKVQLRVNALGMSELSVDADLTGLPVAQQRAHLAAMTAPLVRFGLTGRWGEVKRTTAQQLTVEVIGGPTQRIGYGDFDLVCERTLLTVTRAEHEGSLAGITTRMVDQAKLELLDELLELRSPHDAVRRSLGMQWLRREMTERRDQLAMPAWARELSPSLSEGHRWDEEHPIIEVVDRDVVRHLRPNDR